MCGTCTGVWWYHVLSTLYYVATHQEGPASAHFRALNLRPLECACQPWTGWHDAKYLEQEVLIRQANTGFCQQILRADFSHQQIRFLSEDLSADSSS